MSEVIGQIKSRLDIVDIISSYITVNKKGSNFSACCPFHMEKTASFMISPERQTYKCFGCHVHGDIFTFVQEYENIPFRDALESLAKQAGVSLEKYKGAPKQNDQSEELYKSLRIAQNYFLHQLDTDNGRVAKQYLVDRGFTEEIIEKFGIGYAPEEWQGLINFAKKNSISEEILFKAGLIKVNEKKHGYDFFRHRVMFPVKNAQGQICGFGGRVLDNSEPKYLNSPETPVFNKSKLLFNFNLAKEIYREHQCFIIMEGYTDVMMSVQYQLGPVVASLGTALTEDHIIFLKRYNVPIYLVYDADEAGQKAMERILPFVLKYGVETKAITLPEKLDPAEFLIKHKGKKDVWKELVESSPDLFNFKLQRKMSMNDMNSLESKIKVANEMAVDLKSCREEIRKEVYLNYLSDCLNINRKSLQNKTTTEREKGVKKIQTFKVKKDACYYLLAVMLFESNYISVYEESQGLNLPQSKNSNLLNKWVNFHDDANPIPLSEFQKELNPEENYILSQASFESLLPPKDKLKDFFVEKLNELKKGETGKDLLTQIKLAEKSGDTEKVLELMKKLS